MRGSLHASSVIVDAAGQNLEEGVQLFPAGFLALCGIALDKSKALANLLPPALPATRKPSNTSASAGRR